MFTIEIIERFLFISSRMKWNSTFTHTLFLFLSSSFTFFLSFFLSFFASTLSSSFSLVLISISISLFIYLSSYFFPPSLTHSFSFSLFFSFFFLSSSLPLSLSLSLFHTYIQPFTLVLCQILIHSRTLWFGNTLSQCSFLKPAHTNTSLSSLLQPHTHTQTNAHTISFKRSILKTC